MFFTRTVLFPIYCLNVSASFLLAKGKQVLSSAKERPLKFPPHSIRGKVFILHIITQVSVLGKW